MKKYAIVVAGGIGSRMNAEIPKQFLLIQDRPVIYYTLTQFLSTFQDIHIILVLPEAHLQRGQEIIAQYFSESNIQLVAGGQTRFHSVKNGLKLISEESIVFVHDGVRCLVSREMIQRCYEKAMQAGTAIPVADCKDSVRYLSDGIHKAIDRNALKLVQTPQTFQSNVILKAYEQAYNEAFTDDATVVEAFGMAVELVEGDEKNIKITNPIDLIIAAQYIING